MLMPRVASGDELESARKPLLGGAMSSGSQRLMREPSIRVREVATEQIDQWPVGSKPVLVFGLITNTALVLFSFLVLTLGREENAPRWLRWWAVGSSIRRLLHMARLCMDYRIQRRQGVAEGGGEIPAGVYEKLKGWNTKAGIIWWIIGLCLVCTIGPDDAPQLYRLCVLFLGFEIFLSVVCLAVALVIGIAIFSCLSMALGLVIGKSGIAIIFFCLLCIIVFSRLVADEKGAKNEDIEKLPKLRFWRKNEQQEIMSECDHTDSPVEYVIPVEDAECSICLNAYDDGAELHELPCRHHFHTACVDKWLCINATCPLCKLNIGK